MSSEMIKKWLEEEGFLRMEVPDENARFHYVVNYPDDHVIDIIQPAGKEDMVLIACATSVSPEHQAGIRALSMEKRTEFIWKVRFTLNRFGLIFSWITRRTSSTVTLSPMRYSLMDFQRID